MNSSCFVLKISAESELFNRLLEDDESALSVVRGGDEGLVYSESREVLEELSKGLSPKEFKIEILQVEGWRDTWTKGLTTVEIESLNLKLIPLNEDEEYELSKGEIGLYPGRSFGVGHHETTKLILELMGKHREIFSGQRVLDFGCGSGVLGIIASKLGAKSVHAVDIDPEAVRVTEINCGINNVKNLTTETEIIGEFDILLINTLLPVIQEELPKIQKHLSSSANVLTSGFLIGQISEVEVLFKKQDAVVGSEWGAIFGKIL